MVKLSLTKRDSKSSNSPEDSKPLSGPTLKRLAQEDHLIALMIKRGVPVNRQNYLELENPGADWTKPLDPELEAQLPEELQLIEKDKKGR